jgi:signal transduction histidine kinase
VLSKLDIHESPLNLEPVDPAEMLNDLLNRLQPAMDRKDLVVTTELSFDPPFYADRDSLHMALSNILDNAVKFVPEKGEVALKMRSEPEGLKISISNQFETLSEEDLAKVFEPFYRTEHTRALGSGLGLAIAKKVVERHGGEIGAVSSAGRFEIRITLPATPP